MPFAEEYEVLFRAPEPLPAGPVESSMPEMTTVDSLGDLSEARTDAFIQGIGSSRNPDPYSRRQIRDDLENIYQTSPASLQRIDRYQAAMETPVIMPDMHLQSSPLLFVGELGPATREDEIRDGAGLEGSVVEERLQQEIETFSGHADSIGRLDRTAGNEARNMLIGYTNAADFVMQAWYPGYLSEVLENCGREFTEYNNESAARVWSEKDDMEDSKSSERRGD